MSDEARAEAERRYPTMRPSHDEMTYPLSSLQHFKRGSFAAGAEWQAERDAERIAEALDSRVRAQVAEALLASIRESVTERTDGYPDDPYDFVREFALGVLAILDGEADDH